MKRCNITASKRANGRAFWWLEFHADQDAVYIQKALLDPHKQVDPAMLDHSRAYGPVVI